MAKPDTNRANLRIAHWLKKNRYPTYVHALPPDLKALVDKMISDGVSDTQIANELNAKYGETIKALTEFNCAISRFTIGTYRRKYWKKSNSYSLLVLNGDEELKKDVENVAIEIAKLATQDLPLLANIRKMVENAVEVNSQMKGIDDATSRGIVAYNTFFEGVVDRLKSLGIIINSNPQLPESMSNEAVEGEVVSDPQEIEKLKAAIEAIEGTGRYADYYKRKDK